LDEFLRCDGFTNCHRILSNGLVHIWSCNIQSQ
jgi:hypothetical protein